MIYEIEKELDFIRIYSNIIELDQWYLANGQDLELLQEALERVNINKDRLQVHLDSLNKLINSL